MPTLFTPRLAACVALSTGFVQVAVAADVLIDHRCQIPTGKLDGRTRRDAFRWQAPARRSFTRVQAGSTTAEKFVDASGEGAGTFFFGMLADAGTNTLWTCQLTPVPNATPVKRHTALRGFDLSSGAQKLRWNLPGDNSTCNDFSVGPDKALYISDTANSKIYKLPAGASNADVFLEDRALYGIDGITFLNGVLYVNNVFSNNLYRIPVDASGKAGTPVDIWMDQPIHGPDGMRAANGKLLVAENGSGKISVITVKAEIKPASRLSKWDSIHRRALSPRATVLWIAERGAGKAVSMPMPK